MNLPTCNVNSTTSIIEYTVEVIILVIETNEQTNKLCELENDWIPSEREKN